MSTWTHVAGIVRLDYIRLSEDDGAITSIVHSVLGGMVDYNSPMREVMACTIPKGSEGSLRYDFLTNSDELISSATLVVRGDLRDYDTPNEIFSWFENKLKELTKRHIFLRQAVITVEVEGREPEMKQFYMGNQDAPSDNIGD